jgi:hypothetical protein
MTPATRYAIEGMLGATRHPTDDARAVVVLRGVQPEDRAEVVRMILDKRAERLAYTTRTQRQWQAHTRRPSRARHHDSIEIRERYVRG